jgi:Fe-S-cluster containining protein
MTNTLLPILRENAPLMSLCSICPKPGACCSNFMLYGDGASPTFWKDSWQEDAIADLEAKGLPFYPARIVQEFTSADGRVYVTVEYDCPELEDDGRCGIYADRPSLCRRYMPLSDQLCILTPRSQS